MSWEVDYTREETCPCGKGTYTHVHSSNDWGQYEDDYTMNCPECKGKYEYRQVPGWRSRYGLSEKPGREEYDWVKIE